MQEWQAFNMSSQTHQHFQSWSAMWCSLLCWTLLRAWCVVVYASSSATSSKWLTLRPHSRDSLVCWYVVLNWFICVCFFIISNWDLNILEHSLCNIYIYIYTHFLVLLCQRRYFVAKLLTFVCPVFCVFVLCILFFVMNSCCFGWGGGIFFSVAQNEKLEA